MPRRVEDIKPAHSRSIRDIPKRVHISKVKSDDLEPISSHKISLAQPQKNKKTGSLRWFLLSLGILIIIAGLGYIASVYFARATFTIVPKSVSVEINSTYLVQDSSLKMAATAGSIPYSSITMQGIATTTVPATVGPAVSTKAQGSVSIYNSFSTTAQRLVAGTRFVNSAGKVYRLAGSVVIPGYTIASKTIMPGKVTASIIADQPGESYNISGLGSVSDFKIIAYKGTTKYDSIYARLTGPVSGGMVGTQNIVNPTILASTTALLRKNITSDLVKQARITLPEGYIMYDNAHIDSFATTTTTGIDKSSSLLTVQGTVDVLIFKKTDLINRLAEVTAKSTLGSSKYETSGLEDLNVTINSSKSTKSTSGSNLVISMKIEGEIRLVSSIPAEEIISKILGKTSIEAEQVFKQYASVIESVDGEVMPPWSKIPTISSRVLFHISP